MSRNIDRTGLLRLVTHSSNRANLLVGLVFGGDDFMKEILSKARKPREARKPKRIAKKAPTPESIAEQYLEVLRLRQRLLMVHASRPTRQ